jgi:hypothetical protein
VSSDVVGAPHVLVVQAWDEVPVTIVEACELLGDAVE